MLNLSEDLTDHTLKYSSYLQSWFSLKLDILLGCIVGFACPSSEAFLFPGTQIPPIFHCFAIKVDLIPRRDAAAKNRSPSDGSSVVAARLDPADSSAFHNVTDSCNHSRLIIQITKNSPSSLFPCFVSIHQWISWSGQTGHLRGWTERGAARALKGGHHFGKLAMLAILITLWSHWGANYI